MENTVNQRFKQLLDSKNISQKHFCELTGMPPATVSNIYKGQTMQPKSDFFEAIAIFFPEINLRWLLLGDEPMVLSEGAGYVIREPEGPGYQDGKEMQRMMRTIEQLTETIAQLTKMVNDVPALREEIERLKRDVEKLKKIDSGPSL